MKKYYPQLLVSLSLLASPLVMAENCMQLQQHAKQAYYSNNLSQLQRTQNQMQRTHCDAPQKTYVERQLAYLMYNNLLKKRVQGQVMVNGMKNILRQNNSFWPALVSIADYYHEIKNFNLSSEYYSQALDAINNPAKTLDKDAPSARVMQSLRANSEADLLAADRPPQISKGDGDGLMSFKYKSVRARRKQLPIHFDSAKAKLVGNDLRYARSLYRVLHKQRDPNITLYGHTDPVGSATKNLTLSKKRAAAVEHFLKLKGYKGRISSDGKGESSPLYDPRGRVNAIKHYGKKRWYRMLRRVEIIIH